MSKSLQLSLLATVSRLIRPRATRSCVHKNLVSKCFILPPSPRLDVNLLAADDAIRTGAFTHQSRNSDSCPSPVTRPTKMAQYSFSPLDNSMPCRRLHACCTTWFPRNATCPTVNLLKFKSPALSLSTILFSQCTYQSLQVSPQPFQSLHINLSWLLHSSGQVLDTISRIRSVHCQVSCTHGQASVLLRACLHQTSSARRAVGFLHKIPVLHDS